MDDEIIQTYIVRHSDGEPPADIEEMIEAVQFYAPLFEEAADDELQLRLDEMVLEASSTEAALAGEEADEGDEQPDAVGDAESNASEINNEGIESQLAFVIVKNGLDVGIPKIREALADAGVLSAE